MRSFSSRSVIQTVSALAIAGLMAGCGGSSSSLPMGTSGTPTQSTSALSPAAIFQQQLKTGNFPQSHLKLTQGTQAQYEFLHKAIAQLNSTSRTTKDYASGAPGGFGFVTNSFGLPYNGISATASAYSTTQWHLTDITNTPPTGGLPANGEVDENLYMPVIAPPNGECLYVFMDYEAFVDGGPGPGSHRNNFGALDECRHRIYNTSLDTMSALGYTSVSGTTPSITFYEFNNAVYIFNGSAFVQYTSTSPGPSSNANVITGGNAGAFYVEHSLTPQNYGCPILPNQLGAPGNNTTGTSGGPPAQNGLPGTAYARGLYIDDFSLLTAQAPPNFSTTPVVQGMLASGGGAAAFYGPNGQTQATGGAQPNANPPTTLTCFLHRPTPGSFTVGGLTQGGTPSYTATRLTSGFSITSQNF